MATAQGSLRDTRHRRLGLVAVCAVTALAAAGVSGCSQDAADEQPSQGFVTNLGGEIAVLEGMDGKPEIVGQRPDGTETLDTYRLTAPRQLDTGDIVGIRDGEVVAISPDDPVKAPSLGQATAWFPSVDKGKVWAVTEQTAADCEGRGLPTTVRAKYTVAEHETSGRPAVLDLGENSCRDLGAFAALDETADLDESLAATWSRANLLVIDQGTGSSSNTTPPPGAWSAGARHCP